jgi:outer membrane protein TolC
MRIKYLLSALTVFSLALPSESQVIYGLKDCIGIGLERNYSILVSRNNEAIASNNYTAGNAGFLPSLDLTGRSSSSNISNGEFNTSNNTGSTLGLTIFNGFNVQTTYKKLNELKQIGELNTQLSVETLVSNIVSGYYDYIQKLQLLKNYKYAVSLSRERLRIDQYRYLQGSSSKLQVLQSRVYLNSDSTNFSRQTEVVRAAQVRLNELMALENLGTMFVSKDTSIDVDNTLLYDRLLEETMSKNTSLQIAAKNKTISGYDYKLVMSRSYPYLNLTSGYGYTFNTFSPGNPSTSSSYGLNYGVTLGVNIFDGLNQRRNLKNSLLNIKNTELFYQQAEQGVKADLITIYNAYINYLRLTTLEEQNLQTATENLEIAMERYKLGNLSGLDLREVQKSLLDAKESLLSVQYQAKLAEISLKLISGRIMDYYK